ncbi:TadE/TadG family type IV pilus assembly protein [Rhizobium sp. Rhizsp82]|uniref:TadE/TadG family type IV pilus assembly protein n=1 Tax=Rhizobium sp. Rhizsp82 TaxID=3243057 RepID=UPI0039B3A0F9
MILNRFKSTVRDRSGATAVEFALIAPLFFAIIFSTFEAGWMVIEATMLDRAVDLAIRDIRVGATAAAKTQDQIKAAVCNQAIMLPGCASSIVVEMTDISSGALPSSNTPCVDRGSNVSPVVAFSPGQRGSIMYVRACFTTDPITPLLGLALSMPKDGKGGYFLSSSSAFVNEPGA